MSTRIPLPTARKAVPMAAVVLPLPGPVLTMIRPRRISFMNRSCQKKWARVSYATRFAPILIVNDDRTNGRNSSARDSPVGTRQYVSLMPDMVRVAFEDGEAAIDLLQQNDSGEFVRKRHLAHG